MSRFLERFFLLICARSVLTALGAVMLVASIPSLMEMIRFLQTSEIPTKDAVEDIERVIDGLAGLFVAGGVFLESRVLLRKKALHVDETDTIQHDLNEVAEHNGMGLLLVGLFMEICTAFVGMPSHFINTKGSERTIIVLCAFLTVIAVVILIDFIKDYVRTYWKRHLSPEQK